MATACMAHQHRAWHSSSPAWHQHSIAPGPARHCHGTGMAQPSCATALAWLWHGTTGTVQPWHDSVVAAQHGTAMARHHHSMAPLWHGMAQHHHLDPVPGESGRQPMEEVGRVRREQGQPMERAGMRRAASEGQSMTRQPMRKGQSMSQWGGAAVVGEPMKKGQPMNQWGGAVMLGQPMRWGGQ